MRLYRVETECRKCQHRYRDWVTETQRVAAFRVPAEELVAMRECPRSNCRKSVPVLSRHVRESRFDVHVTEMAAQDPLLRNLRLRADLTEPTPPDLTERQAKICALVLDGYTSRKISRTLHISPSTIRDEISRAAALLSLAEPSVSRSLPRQTIVAFYALRAGMVKPSEAFTKTA